jgi:hypothetical protein
MLMEYSLNHTIGLYDVLCTWHHINIAPQDCSSNGMLVMTKQKVLGRLNEKGRNATLRNSQSRAHSSIFHFSFSSSFFLSR